MSIFSRVKNILSAPDTNDEHLYAMVSDELARGHVRQGLWAKALAENSFDQNRAKATYLQMAVSALKEESRERLRDQRQAQRDLMDSAFELYDRREYEKAYEGLRLRLGRDKNDYLAMACLGQILWCGLAGKTDQAEARRLFDAAEGSNDPGVRLFLGEVFQAIDWQRAMQNYDAAAKNGDEHAKERAHEFRKQLQLRGLVKRPLLQRLLR